MKTQTEIEIQIQHLKEFPGNPNYMTDEQFEQLKTSIQKFGYINYLTIDENFRVIGGNHRLKAMQELGLDKIKVIQVKGFSESEIKAMNIALNKVHGEIDPIKLEEFMLEINKEDLNFMDESELNIENQTEVQEDDFEYTKEKEKNENILCPKCGFKWLK